MDKGQRPWPRLALVTMTLAVAWRVAGGGERDDSFIVGWWQRFHRLSMHMPHATKAIPRFDGTHIALLVRIANLE